MARCSRRAVVAYGSVSLLEHIVSEIGLACVDGISIIHGFRIRLSDALHDCLTCWGHATLTSFLE